MKKILLVVLSVFICLGAYAKNKHKKKKQSGNKIISAKVFHSGCFGHCPTYMVEISNDGIATYMAIRFNADSGTFTKNIGKEKAMEVLDELNKFRVDTCKDMYDNRIPDLPGIHFEIQYGDKTKNIANAKYGPAFLMHLDQVMENVGKKTDNIGWERFVAPGTK